MKMINPKVSIILPVYNGADCVSDSIDSVLAQTYKEFELIIVNDCSTDNTWEILQGYAAKDNRVKIYSNEVNKKLPRTLNAGFEKATGEYLTWTSDDNEYRPEAIQEMVTYLDDNPNCGMVYTDMTIVNKMGKSVEESYQIAAEAKDLRLKSVCGACFMYRKSIADEIGEYNPDLFLAEDYEYWMRISEKSKIVPLHKDLYKYTYRPESLSGSQRWETIKAQKLKALTIHFDYLYSLCENKDDEIAFFNNYIKCSSKENRSECLRKVCAIMPEYKKIDRINRINYCKYRIKVFLGVEK